MRLLFRVFSIVVTVITCTTAPLTETICLAVDLPYLISRESEAIQDAWRTIDELVQENAKLDSPIPDPLFARADLWASVGNHEEALDDYLQATKLLLQAKPNLVDQSMALNRLSDALERLNRRPRPEYPYEANDAFWIGARLFDQKRYDDSVAYFTEASRLMPNDAIYRVYRALALKRIGKSADAERQLTVASSLLRRPDCPERELRGYPIRLERVQGTDRQWVDSVVKSPIPARRLPQIEAAEILRAGQKTFLR